MESKRTSAHTKKGGESTATEKQRSNGHQTETREREREGVRGWRSPSSRNCQRRVTGQIYVWDINTLTYKMSSSSTKHNSKKRKLSKARSRSNHDERDEQIAEFWGKKVEIAEHSCVKTKTGKVYSYPAMVASADRSDEPPAVDAPEEVWVE